MVKYIMVIASSACTQHWTRTKPRAMVTLPPLFLLSKWPNYGTISDWLCVYYFRTKKLPLLENLGCNNFKNSDVFYECCELDVIVDGNSWTYYDLGCMYELWFEILRDFTDYRDYMGLSSVVWLCKWSLSGLISYNLGGSVTAPTPVNFV